MAALDSRPLSVVELALQGLQEERTACVARLETMLAMRGAEVDVEVQGYLRRIDNINAALVRLAGAHVVH